MWNAAASHGHSLGSRHPGARRRVVMYVVAAVMIVAVALYLIQQFDEPVW
jgi:hypothetical protein